MVSSASGGLDFIDDDGDDEEEDEQLGCPSPARSKFLPSESDSGASREEAPRLDVMSLIP